MIKTIGGTKGACHQFDAKCALCKKSFLRTTLHVYKIGAKFYCSYTCYQAAKSAKESKKDGRVNNHFTGINERKSRQRCNR